MRGKPNGRFELDRHRQKEVPQCEVEAADFMRKRRMTEYHRPHEYAVANNVRDHCTDMPPAIPVTGETRDPSLRRVDRTWPASGDKSAPAIGPKVRQVPGSQSDAAIERAAADARGTIRGRLFRRYVALFVAVVCTALTVSALAEAW